MACGSSPRSWKIHYMRSFLMLVRMSCWRWGPACLCPPFGKEKCVSLEAGPITLLLLQRLRPCGSSCPLKHTFEHLIFFQGGHWASWLIFVLQVTVLLNGMSLRWRHPVASVLLLIFFGYLILQGFLTPLYRFCKRLNCGVAEAIAVHSSFLKETMSGLKRYYKVYYSNLRR